MTTVSFEDGGNLEPNLEPGPRWATGPRRPCRATATSGWALPMAGCMAGGHVFADAPTATHQVRCFDDRP